MAVLEDNCDKDQGHCLPAQLEEGSENEGMKQWRPRAWENKLRNNQARLAKNM